MSTTVKENFQSCTELRDGTHGNTSRKSGHAGIIRMHYTRAPTETTRCVAGAARPPTRYACAAAQQSPGSCDVDRPVPASRDAGQLGLQGLQLRADALGVLGAVLAALPVLRTSLGQAGGPRLGLGRRLRSPLLLRLKTWVAQTSASWLCGGFLQRHIMPQTVSWAALAWPHWPWFQHRVAPARPPSAASPRPAG